MKRAAILVPSALVLSLLLGCSYKHLYGETMPGVELKARHQVHVVRQPEDDKGLESMIASRLKRQGFNATFGSGTGNAPAAADVIVSYEDHWQWDMSMYLIVLRIDFRDSKTGELLASGQSYRTSLDRKPPEFMINEIITTMFAGS
jgi:hypothetical protein